MADAKTPKSTGGEQVAFEADPKLEATAGGAGPAAINFEAADDLGGSTSGATRKLKDEASKLGTQAADRARAFAGENKERATNALDEVAKMFEGAALDVDARLGEQYGKYARSAAQGISNFAESLRGKEVDDLFNDATDLVKKSPVIAVGAAAAVGFVVARLIKSGVDAASETTDA
ncbi:hypothetical protein [Sphingomonas sp. Root241]|uniref:hypothetical protein n=1 Tax=Sphingomonas sp. Root241 TaxID=1736501 RepID=UPI0006FA8545|nr:hypothetical protein [Sphingomonas sp. Root241]KRC81939.1 hypothetical protein ASE13_06195 [Sphingomonas sp. Root241]